MCSYLVSFSMETHNDIRKFPIVTIIKILLFADAEAREDAIEQILGVDLAGCGADLVQGGAEFEGKNLGGVVVKGGGVGLAQGVQGGIEMMQAASDGRHPGGSGPAAGRRRLPGQPQAGAHSGPTAGDGDRPGSAFIVLPQAIESEAPVQPPAPGGGGEPRPQLGIRRANHRTSRRPFAHRIGKPACG